MSCHELELNSQPPGFKNKTERGWYYETCLLGRHLNPQDHQLSDEKLLESKYHKMFAIEKQILRGK